MGVAFDIRKHSITVKFMTFWLIIFQPPLLQWSLICMYGSCIVNVSLSTGLQNSAFWLVVISCNDLCLLWGRSSLRQGRAHQLVTRYQMIIPENIYMRDITQTEPVLHVCVYIYNYIYMHIHKYIHIYQQLMKKGTMDLKNSKESGVRKSLKRGKRKR